MARIKQIDSKLCTGNGFPRLLKKVKKPRRGHPAPEAPRQSRRSPRSPEMVLPQQPFRRVAQELVQRAEGSRLRVQPPAYRALQEAAEAYLLQLCEDWQLCALHAKRVSVVSSDVNLVRCLRGENA